jgi:integrase
LNLQIGPTGGKAWVFRFMLNGRSREMGLGPVNAVSLLEARTRAEACRLLLVDKIDPIEARERTRRERAKASAKSITFSEACTKYLSAHKSEWRNAKHRSQWGNTLTTYAVPVFGHLSVADVDTGLVLRVLEPIWEAKHETASRLRGRIESVLDWARGHGYRTGDNPAEWKGNLDALLSAGKPTVEHHPALPYDQIAGFVHDLRKQNGTAARALEFVILTACRTGEAIGATPGEFDLDKALWVVPASRMKAGREHRVPLSPRAVEIIRAQLKGGSDYVFPGLKAEAPLSDAAMQAVLKRMKRLDITVHGFRSTFRDWAGETTAYPREVIEHALAHQLKDKAEAAYARGTLFDKRARLMHDWAKHCEQTAKGGKVTPMRRAS